MATAFSLILNMSVTASIIILCVLLIRACIKKLPKIFSYVLWSVVLFRLLCPVSISLPVSLLAPFSSSSSQTAPSSVVSTMEYVRIEPLKPNKETQSAQGKVSPEEKESKLPGAAVPLTKDEIIEFQESSEATVNTGTKESGDGETSNPTPFAKRTPGEWALLTCCWLWLAGTAALLGITVIQNIRLKKNLAFAYKLRDNIYECEEISTAFVLGIIKPKIYLPTGLPDDVRSAVIMHEQTHLSRGDNIFKFLAFLALALHWFNPLVWLAYKLACDDMEMSCDETVICKLNDEDHPMRSVKLGYGSMLVAVATGRWNLFAPVAFADSDTKTRVKNVAQYKKLTFRAVVAMVLICALFLGISIINPVSASVRDADGTWLITIGDQTFRSDVEILDLSGSFLSNVDIADLRYCRNLKTLNIRDNLLTDLSVLKYCTELQSLDITHNEYENIDFLRSLKHLRQLNFDEYYLGSYDYSSLLSCSELEELNIQGKLNLSCAEAISNLKKLRSISAWSTELDAIDKLSSLESLEEASLGGFTTPELEEGWDELSYEESQRRSEIIKAEALHRLHNSVPNLKSLQCGVGTAEECRMLSLFTELESLSIGYSESSESNFDADSENIFEPLSNLKKLETLKVDISIEENQLKLHNKPEFIRDLPLLRSLSYEICYYPDSEEDAYEALNGEYILYTPDIGLFTSDSAVWESTDLREINIETHISYPWMPDFGNTSFDIAVSGICSFDKLEKLNINSNFLYPVDLGRLSCQETLKELTLDGVKIEGVENIGSYSELETIKLSNFPKERFLYNPYYFSNYFGYQFFLSGNELESLSNLKNLRELRIYEGYGYSLPFDWETNSDWDRVMEQRVEECPSLNLRFLQDLQQLKVFELITDASINNGELESINFAASLESLKIDGFITRIPSLDRLTNLQSLYIVSRLPYEEYETEDDTVEGLGNIAQCPNLKDLTVHGNIISIPSFNGIDQLTRVYIDSESLEDISGLRGCANLSELHLPLCACDEGPTLQSLSKLSELHVRGRLTDWSSLTSLSYLYYLDVYQGTFGDDISVLKDIPNLKRLDLVQCDISDASIPVLYDLTKKLNFLSLVESVPEETYEKLQKAAGDKCFISQDDAEWSMRSGISIS